jgi:hypothetical protein
LLIGAGMLFHGDTLEGIAQGRITLAFRRWKKQMAKPGGRQRTRIGVLAIGAVDVVAESAITADEARAAGYQTRGALLADLAQYGAGDVYRIRLHLAGEDPRIALRGKRPDVNETEEISAQLDRLDAASRSGPWTRKTLALIAQYPARRAPELASLMGLETAPFKRNVRKLKELGLTISLDVGYRLSPRGAALTTTPTPRTKQRPAAG